MDPIILGIFVVGVIITMALPPLQMRSTSRRRQIELMDRQKLIQANVHAGMMKGRLRLAAYLIPLPVIILTRSFLAHANQGVLIGLAFVVVFTCLAGAQFFGVIDKLTKAEMERRKDVNDGVGGEKDLPVMPER